MKKILFKVLVSSLIISASSFAEDFKPNGSLNFTQTFYGNAGKYKTATSHPSGVLNYNFAKEWTLSLQWDRTWNMYNYKEGAENQQDNDFSGPKATVSYNHGVLGDSKIKWTSSLMVENENEFTETSQTYVFAQTSFDFSEYIPKGEYVSANQFAVSPMYIYGWGTEGPSGHVNTGILSLLTNWQLPANFTFTFNAYAFKEWYNGSFALSGENGKSYDDASYFMVLAWLEYSKELYKFNDQTSLAFNFAGGFDPYISSNRKAAWDPFIVGNQIYEWLGPAVDDGNYKKTYSVFALPQLEVTYDYSEDLTFTAFAQVKYSNQVWGQTEKDWKLQPQGGFGVAYNF
ncbi:hypothetical protein [uncultured Cetobacterium sp.]|uniref:FomA family porin-like outer membrane protein n=1 Tax=uncultured Cetobacterium sp. TaxID=527638 RepID=UPI00261CA9F1|nr:hypothetical protein [uncultured Cetobacterium sp.]